MKAKELSDSLYSLTGIYYGFKEVSSCLICITHAKGSNGYIRAKFQRKDWNLHRLVGKLLVEGFKEDLLIRHTCDIKDCCNPEHLIPGTYAQNSQDIVDRLGVIVKIGLDNPSSKLTANEVRRIRISKLSNARLAKIFNVHSHTIYKIKKNISYQDVTN